MNLECQNCGESFENAITIGYCPECIADYQAKRQARRDKQQAVTASLGAFHVAGKWGDPKETPRSVFCEISQRNVCGLCGSDQLEGGYGYAGGFGLGGYNFCLDCNEVQDFSEDLS